MRVHQVTLNRPSAVRFPNAEWNWSPVEASRASVKRNSPPPLPSGVSVRRHNFISNFLDQNGTYVCHPSMPVQRCKQKFSAPDRESHSTVDLRVRSGEGVRPPWPPFVGEGRDTRTDDRRRKGNNNWTRLYRSDTGCRRSGSPRTWWKGGLTIFLPRRRGAPVAENVDRLIRCNRNVRNPLSRFFTIVE